MYLRAIQLGDAVYVELPKAIVEEYNIEHGDRILVPDDVYRNPFADFRVIHKDGTEQTEGQENE